MDNADLQFNISWPGDIDFSTTTKIAARRKYLIPDELYKELLIIWPIAWVGILPPGLLANALNVRTFLRMGLDDSVTISFYVLALSDFAHLFFPLANVVATLLMYLEQNYAWFFIVQPMALYVYVVNVALIFNNWTSLIIAYLAVQRCLCIVMPLHFKSVFTTTRTWGVMTVLAVVAVAPGAAILVAYDVRPRTFGDNRTQYVIVVTPAYAYTQKYLDAIVFSSINVACLAISCGSLVIMSYSLDASVKFRQRIGATTNNIVTKSGKKSGAEGQRKDEGEPIEAAGQKQSSKERTAIIQVALLSAVYLVTNLPKLAIALAAASQPEFSVDGVYRNVYLFLFNLRVTFDYVNSAVNFLVYYKYNTRFRKRCFSNVKEKRSGE